MHDPTLSTAIKEAYASAPSDEVLLDTIELRHPAFDDGEGNNVAIRVVQNHADQDTWVAAGGAAGQDVLDAMPADARDLVGLVAALEDDAPMDAGTYVAFIAMAFEFELPPVDSSPVPEMQLTIDNVGQEITDQLDLAVGSQTKVEVTYRAYLASDITGPQNNPVLTLTLSEVSVDVLRCAGRARMLDIGNKQFPSEKYTAKKHPGLAR